MARLAWILILRETVDLALGAPGGFGAPSGPSRIVVFLREQLKFITLAQSRGASCHQDFVMIKAICHGG